MTAVQQVSLLVLVKLEYLCRAVVILTLHDIVASVSNKQNNTERQQLKQPICPWDTWEGCTFLTEEYYIYTVKLNLRPGVKFLSGVTFVCKDCFKDNIYSCICSPATVWHPVETCPGCNLLLALWQLGQAPSPGGNINEVTGYICKIQSKSKIQ